jgi:hypothetical protein
MTDINQPLMIPLSLLASLLTLFVGMITYAFAVVLEKEEKELVESLLRDAMTMLHQSRKGVCATTALGLRKRRYIEGDRGGAQQSNMDDYL